MPGQLWISGLALYIDSANIDTVLVQDEQGQIRGALFPGWVRSQISQQLGMTFNSLTEALAELAQRPGEAMRSYRHEYLTFERPNLVWCESGSHFTYTLPCPDHG